jgi:hypothetical protein
MYRGIFKLFKFEKLSCFWAKKVVTFALSPYKRNEKRSSKFKLEKTVNFAPQKKRKKKRF